jgi:TonB family protein
MKTLKLFLIISFVIHSGLILALVILHTNDTRIDISQVYQVSIVTNIPSGGTIAHSSQNILSLNSRSVSMALDEVPKEQPLPDENEDMNPTVSPPQTGSSQQTVGQANGTGHIPGGGDPYEIALWKTRARSMVQTIWKSAPDDTKLKTPLHTTCLLMVSRTGEVLEKKLLVSSGNEDFDNSILLALGKISRFPPPPLVLIAGGESVDVPMSFASAR